MINLFALYQFIKLLATPFEEWDAYNLGIIDANGNKLKSRKDLKTTKERSAWSHFHVLVRNIKQLIEKIPGGKSRLASYAAALYLIKEHNMFESHATLTETYDNDKIQLDKLIEYIQEELSVGSGEIAGLGDDEPIVQPSIQHKYKRRNKRKPKT